MKGKFLISLVIIAGTIIAFKVLTPIEMASSTPTDPAYAKWGRIAMERVMEKYPSTEIIDYKHVGREVGETTSKETFKLWLRSRDQHEFGVYITITFDNQTNQIIKIDYKETDR